MVFVWSSGRGPRRGRRGPRYGGGYRGHHAGHHHGRYARRRGYGHGRREDGCLRDLLLLNTGCCLVNAVGCGMDSMLVAPTTVRAVRHSRVGEAGTRPVDRLVAAVRVYQQQISPKRPPCCRFSPSCSAYAVQALERHGARRGSWLTVRRLLRCRPGAAGGADSVPR